MLGKGLSEAGGATHRPVGDRFPARIGGDVAVKDIVVLSAARTSIGVVHGDPKSLVATDRCTDTAVRLGGGAATALLMESSA